MIINKYYISVEIERRLLASDLNGETALHLAVREGDEEMAKWVFDLWTLIFDVSKDSYNEEKH